MLDLDQLKHDVLEIEEKLIELESIHKDIAETSNSIFHATREVNNFDFIRFCYDDSYCPRSQEAFLEKNLADYEKSYNQLWNSIEQMIISLISSALSNIEEEIEKLNCTLNEITSNANNDSDIRTQCKVAKIQNDIEKLKEKHNILMNFNYKPQSNLNEIYSVVGKLYHLFVYDSSISSDSNMISNSNLSSLLYYISCQYRNTYINTYTLLRKRFFSNDINAAISYKNKLIDLKVLSESGLFIMSLSEIRELEDYYFKKSREQKQNPEQ